MFEVLVNSSLSGMLTPKNLRSVNCIAFFVVLDRGVIVRRWKVWFFARCNNVTKHMLTSQSLTFHPFLCLLNLVFSVASDNKL